MGKGLAAACHVARIKMALRVYLYEHETVTETLMSLNRFLYDFLYDMPASDVLGGEEARFPIVLPLSLAIFDPASGQVEVGVACCWRQCVTRSIVRVLLLCIPMR